jgi:hypothetical protein
MQKGLEKSGIARTGAVIKAVLRVLKASLWAGVQTYRESFRRRAVRGLAIMAKCLTNFL